jgi:hypothetical protein
MRLGMEVIQECCVQGVEVRNSVSRGASEVMLLVKSAEAKVVFVFRES